MCNNHHTKFHQNPMNKESGVRDRPLFPWGGGGGGIMISRRKESFLHHRLSTCKFFLHSGCADNFLKISQILHNILGGLCRHFSRCTSGADNFFKIFFIPHADNFFPNHDTPGENNGSSLMLADSPPPKLDRGSYHFRIRLKLRP